jgi:RNA polymerase sigma-B factor
MTLTMDTNVNALLVAFHRDGDLAARDRALVELMPLVRALASRYAGRGEPLEDLVQVGSIGLIKAVDRFEPDREVEFAAFAIPNILGEIKRHLRDRCGAIRIPRRYQEASVRVRTSRSQLTADLRRDPTSSELAAAAELDENELAETLRAEQARAPLTLADASNAARPQDDFDATDDRLAIESGLRSLDPRERQALGFRYFGDLQQSEIAARLGVSQTHASRLIASGLAKLHDDFEGDLRCAAREKPLNSWHGDSRSRRGSAAGRRRRQTASAVGEE